MESGQYILEVTVLKAPFRHGARCPSTNVGTVCGHRALASEVVLGHRARARSLIGTGFRQFACPLYLHKLLKH